MQGYDYYRERAFLIVYFISVYSIMLFSLLLSVIAGEGINVFVSYAIPQIIYIAVTVIYSRMAKVNILKAMPIRTKMKASKYLWTALVTVGVFSFSLLPNVVIMFLFNKAGLNPTVNVPDLTNVGNILLAILIICIMPAIGEEMVFRGVGNSSFKEYGGITVILLSGLLFSLSHFNIAQTVYQFFLGVLLSYLYLKTNNLLVPIMIHFLNNLLALFVPVLFPFFRSVGLTGSTFAVIVPMFFIGLFIAALAIRKLVDDTIKSDVVTVFEYHPEEDNFVAIATENANENAKRGIIKRAGNEIARNSVAIISIFNKRTVKEKINRFKELYPKRKNINTVIKFLIAAIIGLWLISALL